MGYKEGTVVQSDSAPFLNQFRTGSLEGIRDAHADHSPANFVGSHGCDLADLFFCSLPIVSGSERRGRDDKEKGQQRGKVVHSKSPEPLSAFSRIVSNSGRSGNRAKPGKV